MATPKTNAGAAPGNGSGVEEGFLKDQRGLPMYAPEGDGENEATRNTTVRGYLVGANVLKGKEKPFVTLIVKLTRPAKAMVDKVLKDIPAGEYIYVPGANLDDLVDRALDPVNVYEYILKPEAKRVAMKVGKMVKYDRQRALQPVKRSDVTLEYAHVLTAGELSTKLLTTGKLMEGDADFDPAEMEGARS